MVDPEQYSLNECFSICLQGTDHIRFMCKYDQHSFHHKTLIINRSFTHTVLYLVVQWRTYQRSPPKQLVGPLTCCFFKYEIHISSFLMTWLPMMHNHFRETSPITSSLSFSRESIKGPKTVPMVSTYMHNVLSILVMDQYMAVIIWIDSSILCSYNALCHIPFPCKSPMLSFYIASTVWKVSSERSQR